jgi:hypothetical protein
MPAGYSLEKGAYLSQITAPVRIPGYEADYTKPGVRDGLIRVASRAAVLASPAAARTLLTALFKNPPANGVPYRRVPVSWRLGDESRLYLQSGTGTATGLRLRVYLVIWRSHVIVASLSGGGIAGTFDVAQVVTLARKQQARIARAAH